MLQVTSCYSSDYASRIAITTTTVISIYYQQQYIWNNVQRCLTPCFLWMILPFSFRFHIFASPHHNDTHRMRFSEFKPKRVLCLFTGVFIKLTRILAESSEEEKRKLDEIRSKKWEEHENRNVGVSHFRRLRWKTLTLRLCTLIELTRCFAGR